MQSPHGHWWLRGREILVAQEGIIEAWGDTFAAYLAICARTAVWRDLATQGDDDRIDLLVEQRRCPRSVLRELTHLGRALRRDEPGATPTALASLIRTLRDEQRGLRSLADQCNGRTIQRRMATLQRLFRVRQLIERSEGPLNLAALARNANYSPWHLMRMYRDVFGETPSSHLARLRLARAWTLVRDSELLVCQITERLGFESQSAFCRAFKSAYGLTTTQARHLPATSSVLNPRPSHVRPRTRTAPRPQSALR